MTEEQQRDKVRKASNSRWNKEKVNGAADPY